MGFGWGGAERSAKRSTFSVDGEAARGGSFGVSRRKIGVILLETSAIKSAGLKGSPFDAVRARRHIFGISGGHFRFDGIFQRGNFRVQFFLHTAKLLQFLGFAFHILCAHRVCLLWCGNVVFLLTIYILHEYV